MRFVVDECTGPGVARWLQSEGHTAFSIYNQARGSDDDAVIQLAFEKDSILITNEKDFGEKVFRSGKPHHGIILLRLEDERRSNKIAVLSRLLTNYADRIPGSFVVATEKSVRIRENTP
jgi:predicted nuclease of predicted toxin-antitoxin system